MTRKKNEFLIGLISFLRRTIQHYVDLAGWLVTGDQVRSVRSLLNVWDAIWRHVHLDSVIVRTIHTSIVILMKHQNVHDAIMSYRASRSSHRVPHTTWIHAYPMRGHVEIMDIKERREKERSKEWRRWKIVRKKRRGDAILENVEGLVDDYKRQRRKENKRIVPNKVIIEWRRSEKKRLAGLGERSVRRRWNQGSELIKK